MVAFQACASVSLVPIFKLPLLTALTTKEVTLPSTSASSPWASRSPRVISTAVSSLVVSTAAVKVVRVGMSFVPVAVTVTFWVVVPP